MTTGTRLPRPAAAVPGPLDERLYDLVEARFRRVVERRPSDATFIGIHDYDATLGDGTREAVLGEIADERAHLAALGSFDDATLSPEARLERDLERYLVEKSLFDLERHRVWERRSTAIETTGDALFGLLARDFAPLRDRLGLIAARVGDIPRYLAEHRTRPIGPQVATWQAFELDAADDVPAMMDDLLELARGELPGREAAAFGRGVERAKAAIAEHATWVRDSLATAVDDWPLGPELLAELIELRRFDGLGAAEIEAIGEDRLEHHRDERRRAAIELDPDEEPAAVIRRVARDHPATFAEAMDGYRRALDEARAYLVEHAIVTLPADDRLRVIETPPYLRNLMPWAAYFFPSSFDEPVGIFSVTPSPPDDPRGMEHHSWTSIVNKAIHEGYPGHHLQMTVANEHSSLTRLQVDAPEYLEGWAMYCEQMMREEGFEDGAASRVTMHNDAMWRACRVILDIRMHRDGLGVNEAAAFLTDTMGFPEASAHAEVRRYTVTPTVQLSYILGKVLLLRLRDDVKRQLGAEFDLRAFHDTVVRNGVLPISFHRRILEDAAWR